MLRVPLIAIVLVLLGIAITPEVVAAQPPVDDKTGTNPLNLQHTVDVSNAFRSLPDALYTNGTQYEYLVPLARRRVRVGLAVPFVSANITGRTEFGLGDVGASTVWIPWMNDRRGLLAGAEVTWSTATHDALGVGAHTVAVHAALPFVWSGGVIVTPRASHRSAVGSDRVDWQLTTIGLSTVWRMTATRWVGVEPEVAFDSERDERLGSVTFEYGHVLFGGVGTYVRPSLGVGSTSARPFDWALEVGFRVIP